MAGRLSSEIVGLWKTERCGAQREARRPPGAHLDREQACALKRPECLRYSATPECRLVLQVANRGADARRFRWVGDRARGTRKLAQHGQRRRNAPSDAGKASQSSCAAGRPALRAPGRPRDQRG